MARFSEEEVEFLYKLVDMEIYETECSHLVQLQPDYLPFLRQLAQKLGNYYIKHYPEDKDDA